MGAELPTRWDAEWVWCGDTGVRVDRLEGERDPEVVNRFAMFRRIIELEERPSRAVLRAVANSRLVAWVNGEEVARGPVRSDPRRVRAEVADVASALRAGRNVVALLARYYGVATSWWLPSPVTLGLGGASVAAELRVGEDVVVGTDGEWRGRPGGVRGQGGAPPAPPGL